VGTQNRRKGSQKDALTQTEKGHHCLCEYWELIILLVFAISKVAARAFDFSSKFEVVA
jgi:hypothetical protein